MPVWPFCHCSKLWHVIFKYSKSKSNNNNSKCDNLHSALSSGRLQHGTTGLNAATRLVSGTRKYDRRLSQRYTCWLALAWCVIEFGTSSPSQSTTGVCTTRRQSTRQTAVSLSWDVACRQRLRSAHRRQLDTPRYQRTTLGRRAFSVTEPTVWNSRPDELRDETENIFLQSLKTLLFRQY